MRPHGSAEELERRRRRAIALLEEGYMQSEVARMVGVSPASVTRWRQAHEKEGDAGLDAIPVPGRPSKLSDAEKRKLVRLLKQGPRKHGYAMELWTLKRVAELIRKQFRVTYDPSGVWHLLRGLGWSCQKPERRARERDEDAIVRWRTHDWPRIKKRRTKRA
jgi:transposase